MNDSQKLAIWLDIVKAAIISPTHYQPAPAAHLAAFAVETADAVMLAVEERIQLAKEQKP